MMLNYPIKRTRSRRVALECFLCAGSVLFIITITCLFLFFYVNNLERNPLQLQYPENGNTEFEVGHMKKVGRDMINTKEAGRDTKEAGRDVNTKEAGRDMIDTSTHITMPPTPVNMKIKETIEKKDGIFTKYIETTITPISLPEAVGCPSNFYYVHPISSFVNYGNISMEEQAFLQDRFINTWHMLFSTDLAKVIVAASIHDKSKRMYQFDRNNITNIKVDYNSCQYVYDKLTKHQWKASIVETKEGNCDAVCSNPANACLCEAFGSNHPSSHEIFLAKGMVDVVLDESQPSNVRKQYDMYLHWTIMHEILHIVYADAGFSDETNRGVSIPTYQPNRIDVAILFEAAILSADGNWCYHLLAEPIWYKVPAQPKIVLLCGTGNSSYEFEVGEEWTDGVYHALTKWTKDYPDEYFSIFDITDLLYPNLKQVSGTKRPKEFVGLTKPKPTAGL